MSAYFVSDAHINVMLTFALQNRILLPDPDAPHVSLDLHGGDHATRIGRALLLQNARSLFARYCTRIEMVPELARHEFHAKAYVFRPDIRLRSLGSLLPVAIIKASHCFDYQACESTDYETTSAAKIMLALRDGATHYLPHYAEVPWSIPEQSDS
jgi:hypothetical protein